MLRLQLQGRPALHFLGYLRQSCHLRHENWESWEAGSCLVLNLSSCSFFHASWFTRSSCLSRPPLSLSLPAHSLLPDAMAWWTSAASCTCLQRNLLVFEQYSQGYDVMMEVVKNNRTVHMILENTAAISLHVCLFLFYFLAPLPIIPSNGAEKGSETVPCRSPSFCWILLQARVQFTCRETEPLTTACLLAIIKSNSWLAM